VRPLAPLLATILGLAAAPPARAAGPERPPEAARLVLSGYALLSRLDGPRCPHRPSCAAYAREAVARHGLVLGGFAGAARLLRGTRSSALRLLPAAPDGGLLDPLEEATFWFAARASVASEVDAPATEAAAGPPRPDPLPPLARAEREVRAPRLTPGEEVVAPAPAPPERAVPPAAADALRFADWLFAHGDLDRAAGEYERYLFLAPDGADAARAELQAARALAGAGKTEAAAAALRALAAGSPDPALRDAALFELGRVRFAAGDPARAATALAAYAERAPRGGPGPGRARLLLALALLRTGDLTGADGALALGRADPELAPAADELRRAAAEVARAPRRSALAAGLLSAALPGLGHAYAGDPAAGAGALLLNGVFLWATVEAFRRDQPALGVVLAGAESLWYGGAIFGAAAEAMRFNRDAHAGAVSRVEERFRWVIEVEKVPGGGTAGVRAVF
jgi:tetratricopeptide (TPR) repeat protein